MSYTESENQLPRSMTLEHYRPLSLELCHGQAPAFVSDMLGPGVVVRRRRCLECGAEFDTQEQLMGTDPRVVSRGLEALIGGAYDRDRSQAIQCLKTLASMRTQLERALELVQRAIRPGRPA